MLLFDGGNGLRKQPQVRAGAGVDGMEFIVLYSICKSFCFITNFRIGEMELKSWDGTWK
jgi:hypothetical protein